MLKVCPGCGKEFNCNGIFCWCRSAKVNRNDRQILTMLSNDCYCPECLNKLSGK